MDPTVITAALIPLDVFSSINSLNTKALTTIRTLSVTAGILIFIGTWWKSKGSPAQSLITAGLVILGLVFVFKITDVKKMGEDTLDNAAPTTIVATAAPHETATHHLTSTNVAYQTVRR